MEELTKNNLRDLILSVGTHRGQRPLSPIEVAELFNIAKEEGKTNRQIADMVLFKDTTMVGRFLHLLKLSSKVKHLVDWGPTGSTISFSTAAELLRLDVAEQGAVVDAALEHSLTKSEVAQIVQIRKRSNKDIGTCIDEILKSRPQIVRKHVFVGAIFEEKTSSFLKNLKQRERDILLRKIMAEVLPGIEWSGRLGEKRFSLVGGEHLAQQLHTLEPDFEHVINQQLSKEVISG